MKPRTWALFFCAVMLTTVVYTADPVGTSVDFKGPVGLQTYSLRNQINKDGAKAYDYIKEQGFEYVEIGLGNHYGMTKEETKATLNKLGLKPIAAHGGLDYLLKETVIITGKLASVLGTLNNDYAAAYHMLAYNP